MELAAQIAAGSLNDVTSKTVRQRSKIVAIRHSLPGQQKSLPYMAFTGGPPLAARDLAHLSHAFRQLLSDGVGSSTSSFRAPVAQSSHLGLKPFHGHFLDAATTRSMTGSDFNKGISKNSIFETLLAIKSIIYNLQIVQIDNF